MSTADRPQDDFYRGVFDSLGAGVLVTDRAGRVRDCNTSARRIVGRPRDDLLGRDLHTLLYRGTDGRRLPRDECRVLAVLDRDRPDEGSEECLLRGDGVLVPIIWAATPLHHGDQLAGLVVVFHDFSLQREAADQTAAYLAALEELTARLAMVSEVSTVLISSADIEETLNRLVRLVVPELGDWAAVDLITPGRDRSVDRIALYAPGRRHTSASLTGPLPAVPRTSRSALARALHGSRPLVLDAADMARGADSPLGRAHQEMFERLDGRTAVVVPLRTHRQVFGALTVARTTERRYTDDEAAVLADVGQRAGLVMESARLYHQQRNVAETLQRQLLTPLPQVDHLRMGARYQPAQAAAEIGGDWYDAFLLGDGVMALVIGDVVGHDLQAAAHMAEVRNMLRALAWDRQEPPSLIMQRLDEAVTHTSDAPMASALFARVEGPEGGPWQLHWANAGHPPPLLVTADGQARLLEADHGPVLGLNSALHLGLDWPDAREDLPPESTLLLYTDGLVESRGRTIGTGLSRLRRHAAALAHHDLEDFLDELLVRIAPSGDDVALLALRMPAAGEGTGPHPVPPPQQQVPSPAAPERAAPGTRVEGAPVRDSSQPPEETPGLTDDVDG
ncbi:SpoIIE family protein phosphatase [Streptomyces sp. NPDC058045]|uniref:SpoIIE family protein phosphatase n=1 Tax=Streptomyces sp. NPDC058045 TaxID=3346311 RepID=UPI0036E5FB9D